MRFIISILILVKFAWCTAQTEAEVCADTTKLTNVIKEVTTISRDRTTIGDYYYEVWANSGTGSGKLSLYNEDAAFKAEWDNPDDFLGRVGARWPDRTGQEYAAYGNMVAEYTYTRSGEKTAGERYNFIGIYGWAYNDTAKNLPLVEYYIIDDWFGNDEFSETDPIPESTACHDSEPGWVCQKGSFTVDGAEYKIYTNWRVNKPSIIGDTTFIQYFSIRQQYRKCGKITISEHFKKWDSLGLRTGKLYEASLLVEVQKGQGWIDFSHARVLTNVPNNELEDVPKPYAPACDVRTPNAAGNCTDVLDGSDAPPCYVLPDNKCGTSCPENYEPDTATNGGKCVPSDSDRSSHIVRWGWVLCLLFVVLVL